MTPEQCKHHLEAGNFQAFIEGRLEYRSNSGIWRKGNDLAFDLRPEDYRQLQVVKRPLTFLECCKLVGQNGNYIYARSEYGLVHLYKIMVIEPVRVCLFNVSLGSGHGINLKFEELIQHQARFKDTNVPLWIESEDIK